MFSYKKILPVAAVTFVLTLQACSKSETQPAENATTKSAETVASMAFADNISQSDLVGSWTALTGKGLIEALPDGTLKFTNENKMVASGKLSIAGVEAPDWNVTGKLSQDKKTLVWSNGSVWTR